MQDFERFTGVNLGGYKAYQFAPMEYIETLPTVVNGSCANPVVFVDGKQWLSAYSTPNTINVQESGKQTKSGMLFKLKISSFYPKQTPAALANLLAMCNHKFAVLVADNNGNKKLFLNMRFNFSPQSQNSPNKRAGYAMSFYLESLAPAPYYPF